MWLTVATTIDSPSISCNMIRQPQERQPQGQQRRQQPLQQRRQQGYFLLEMLIVMAISLVLYYLMFRRPEHHAPIEQQQAPDTYPWVQDWRIRGSAQRRPKGVKLCKPSPDQPQFTEAMLLRASVTQDGHSRGSLELRIQPDGAITGSWQGSYPTSQRSRDEVIAADVSGNTDATRMYRDKQGADPAQLFLITKGTFLMLQTSRNTHQVKDIKGDIYIIGWIAPDFTARGQLHLTSDKHSQQVFNWSGRCIPWTDDIDHTAGNHIDNTTSSVSRVR